MSRYSPAPASLDKQVAFLKLRDPAGEAAVRQGRLVWRFRVQPSPLSRIYKLRLQFRPGGLPQVVVTSPDLVLLAEGRRLPHVYDQEAVRLCLYMPGTGEWNDRQLLADTLVPWSVLWLFYFEEWLLSGEWKGGGVHPAPDSQGHQAQPHQRRQRWGCLGTARSIER